ncbi:hypothetical protein V496_04103 [Pseudogymnoascus sp. VKM F-4515 (FW-2607)]|nr:hypothetical protein V496_04103 [Pseudogymnoascus sp. VKM F-4515 (FW-2607)]
MVGCRWSEGHLALFEALGQICDRVGDDNARDLAQSIKKPNGATFIQELRELQQKADIADIITRDNVHSADIQPASNEPKAFAKQLQEWKWKAQILDTLHNSDSDAASSLAIADPRAKELAVRLQSLREKAQLYDEINGTSKPDTGDVQSRLNDALSVRKELISRLRRVRENRSQWIQYAHSLAKRLEKREATLAEHDLLSGVPFKNKGIGMERPMTSEPEVIFKEPRATDPSRVTPEDAPVRLNCSLVLPGTTDDNDLDGDTMVTTPGTKTPKPVTLARVLGEPQSVTKAGPEFEIPTCTHIDPRSTSGQPAQLDHLETVADEPPQLPRLVPLQEASLDRDAAANTAPASSQEHHTSSTQGEADDAAFDLPTGLDNHPAVTPSARYQVEPSSDAPVVVSTRAVRKRKAKSSPQKVKIKTEIELSSPVAFLGISTLEPQESLDLDEIGQKTITPKKKRRVDDPGFSFLGDENAESDFYHYKHPPTFNEGMGRSPVLAGPLTPQITRRAAQSTTALQPKSSNKPILPRTSAKYTPAKRLRHAEAPGETPFAEDGESESRINGTAQNRKLQVTKLDAYQRLSSLLNTTSPNSSLFQTPSIISNKRTPRTAGNSHRSTAERDKKRAAKRIEAFRDGSDGPDDEPFRSRPLWRLGLRHFKVNPDHNQGYDYAFRDVVRGREQRKCLPGCTNPECCGNGFRKLAELTTGQAKNQSSDMDTEDERLLEDFLGGNIHKLQAMSADERQETLIQAKARDLANKHGKHRHAFERRQSPPGFWRADFPTTQEVQSDRAEAADFERELVRKRYEEAMRGGGKWMFRDE